MLVARCSTHRCMGFVGSHVLTELQEHDHEITALVRDGTGRHESALRIGGSRRSPLERRSNR